MKLQLSLEERANIYMFVGGLAQIPAVNRENRRKLARLANKFRIDPNQAALGPIELNQKYLNYLLVLLNGAIVNGDKAKLNAEVTEDQRANIDKVNVIFKEIVDKGQKLTLQFRLQEAVNE